MNKTKSFVHGGNLRRANSFLQFQHKKLILLQALIMATIPYRADGIQWLALYEPGNSSTCHSGRTQKWLTKTQSYICIELYPQLLDAAGLTIATCQDMFKYRRWNCSSINSTPKLTPDLITGTREQAIVYAISSAAFIYSLTRSCAQGNIYNCPCNSKLQTTVLPQRQYKTKRLPPHGIFKWKGCNNNVKWAVKTSRNFLDSPYRKLVKHKLKTDNLSISFQEVIAYMNHHNTRIGRKNMEQSLSVNCQCHGISGSCSMRTCWRGLPHHLDDDGLISRFRALYNGAVEKSPRDYKEIYFKDVSKKLIYVTKSPDYCTKDLRTGSQGTVGRFCNESSQSQNSCDSMCCGRGYRSQIIRREERCRCKYYWCCYVKCKTCSVILKVNRCL